MLDFISSFLIYFSVFGIFSYLIVKRFFYTGEEFIPEVVCAMLASSICAILALVCTLITEVKTSHKKQIYVVHRRPRNESLPHMQLLPVKSPGDIR